MASRADIQAGKAYIEIYVKNSALMRGLDAAQKRIASFGRSVTDFGKKLTMAGGLSALPFVAGVKAAADFEQQMKMVSTMLEDAEKFMPGFSEGIKQLAVEFGEGTDVLAKGLYDLLSASVAPAQSLDVLRVAVKAAKGGITDTAVAVDGLTSVLNAFQLSADQAQRVSDIMFATVKRGKLTFPDLASNIGKVAPMARAAGMSVEDMMAAIATMTRQVLSAEEAAIRLVNIIKTAPESAGNLATLVDKYVGKSLSDIQVDFPEIRASGGLAALAADIAGFRKDMELMRNSAGQSDEAFRKMTGGIWSGFNKIKQVAAALFVSIGEAIAGPVLQAFNGAIKAGRLLVYVFDQNRNVIRAVAAAVLTVGGIGATLVGIGIGMQVVAFVLSGIIGAITGVAAIMGAVFTAAPWALLTVLVYQLSGLTDGFWGLNSTAQQAAGSIQESIGSRLRPVIAAIGSDFKAAASDAMNAWSAVSDALAAGDMKLAAQTAWAGIQLVWYQGTQTLNKYWQDAKWYFLATWQEATTTVAKFFVDLWAGIQTAWVTTVAFLTSTWSALSTMIANAWNRMEQGAGNFVIDAAVKVGAVSEEFGKAWRDELNKPIESKIAARNDQSGKQWAEVEAQKNKALEEIEKGRADTSKALDEDKKRYYDELNRGYDKGLADHEKALSDAQANFGKAKTVAAETRKKAEENAAATKPGGAEEGAPVDIAAKQKISVAGTFSGAAMAGMGVGSAAERTAKAVEATKRVAEKQLKVQEQTIEVLRNSNMAFS